MADHHFHAALLRCKRPNVPNPQRVVHGIGDDVVAVRAETQSCHRIGVPLHLVEDVVFPQIPHLDIVVDAGRNHLFGRIVERHRRHLVAVVQGHCVAPLPAVPNFDRTIVGSAAEQLRPSARRVDRVDKRSVA